MSTPVIICGKTEAIGAGVIEDLKLEYEVIHFVMTPEAGVTQIPAILKGDQSVPSESKLGSKNYSQPPKCIILGGEYNKSNIEVMMEAAKDLQSIPWIRPDLTKSAPPLGPEYGNALVRRIKELIPQLEAQGKADESKLFYY